MTAVSSGPARAARFRRPASSSAARAASRPAPAAVHLGHYARNVVRIGLVMRLVALTAASISLAGDTPQVEVLLGILMVSLTSFSVLFWPGAGRVLLRHPVLVVADSILAFTILALLGPGSPVGLATVLTALILGAFFGRTLAVVFGALLLALYVLALAASVEVEHSFMTLLGLPVIYVCFLVVGVCARDADDKQERMAAQLASERAARASADERARLARELHDSVGKSLYGISMLASGAARSPYELDDSLRDRLVLISNSAKDAAEQARMLIKLQRAASGDVPFAQSLAQICEQWSVTTGVLCEFSWSGGQDEDPDVRHETAAIVLEALENVARHADANLVRVTYNGQSTPPVLTIADDGAGFTVETKDGTISGPAGHYGLIGMAERANRCGAHLDVSSKPGSGTRVSIIYSGGKP